MKILLVSDLPPSSHCPTGVFLKQLCSWVPKDDLSAFFVQDLDNYAAIHPDFAGLKYRHFERPSETHKRSWPGRSAALQCFIKELYIERSVVDNLIKEASEFAIESNADVIWCVLQGQTMFRIANGIRKRTNLPTITQVLEEPEGALRAKQTDGLSKRMILQTFDEVISKSRVCATASWAMADSYRGKYGVETVAILPSLDRDWAQPPATAINEGNEVVIGYAGHSIDCTEEWHLLLKMLDYAQWNILGREVFIKVIGNSSGEHFRKNIQHLGEREKSKTIKILSTCDVLYCPYWFDFAFAPGVRQNFPSKLTTYLAAGRPILFHGPQYSSPSSFLKQHNAGIFCHHLLKADLYNALALLTFDQQLYGTLAQNGSKAFHENLTFDAMRSSFSRAFGVLEIGK